MRLRRPVLRDAALLLLALATVALAVHVVTRDEPAVLSSPSPVVTSSPEGQDETAVRAVFLGSDLILGTPSLPQLLGQQLGWQVEVEARAGTGFVTGPAGSRYPDRIGQALGSGAPDVVVIASTAAPQEEADGLLLGGNAQFVLAAVRDAAPEAEIVLIGPVGAQEGAAAAQREVLTAVAARFGAVFVDPVGARYLTGRPELITAAGGLTPEGARVVADRLADDLRRVLPRTLFEVNDG